MGTFTLAAVFHKNIAFGSFLSSFSTVKTCFYINVLFNIDLSFQWYRSDIKPIDNIYTPIESQIRAYSNFVLLISNEEGLWKCPDNGNDIKRLLKFQFIVAV